MDKGLYVNPTTFRPFSKNKMSQEIATRQVAQGDILSWFNDLPDPDPILRKLNSDLTVYKDLLADDEVGSVVTRLKNEVKSLEWGIDADKDKQREIDLCNEALDSLAENDCSTKDIISQSVHPHFWGQVVFEAVLKKVSSDKWLPVKFQAKPLEWFKYDAENYLKFITNTNLDGIYINGPYADKSFKHRFFVLRNEPSYENPYGIRALSRCFWPVVFKRGGLKFFATFIEKYGMPHVTVKHPPGYEEVAELVAAASRMVQDAVAAIPQGNDVEIHRAGEKASADIYKMYIDMQNASIQKAILLNALSTEHTSKGGYSSAEAGNEQIASLGKELKDYPEELFKKLFKSIVDINIGSGIYPEFTTFEEDDPKKDFSERDKNLKEIGVRFTKKYFSSKYNLQDDEFELVDSVPQTFQSAKKEDIIDAEFSESDPKLLKDVSAAELVEALPDSLLQSQINTTLKPVLDMINEAKEFSEVEKGLKEIYPKMDSSAIEKTLTRLYFLSETLGRIDTD